MMLRAACTGAHRNFRNKETTAKLTLLSSLSMHTQRYALHFSAQPAESNPQCLGCTFRLRGNLGYRVISVFRTLFRASVLCAHALSPVSILRSTCAHQPFSLCSHDIVRELDIISFRAMVHILSPCVYICGHHISKFFSKHLALFSGSQWYWLHPKSLLGRMAELFRV